MFGKPRSIAGFVLAMCCFATAASAAADRLAAHVVALDNLTSDRVTVLRSGHAVGVTFDLPLYKGDTLTVAGTEGSVRIRYADGRDAEVTALSSPYSVGAPGPARSAARNYVAALWEDVTRHEDGAAVTTLVRGGGGSTPEPLRLLLPGLADGQARISLDGGPLMLGWSGGEAPFRIRLTASTGAPLLDETRLDGHRLITNGRPLQLPPGTYALSVEDSAGAVARGAFSVAPGIAKTSAADRAPDDVTEDVAATLAAAPAEARLGAYQRLAGPVLAGWPPALALANWLEHGAPRAPPATAP